MTRLTTREACVLTAFTGTLLCDFAEFQRYSEEILQRPVLTHQFAEELTWTALKEMSEAEARNILPVNGGNPE